MRILVALSLLACAAPALAQEQEGKLLDRLLRPDMKMQNGAQNKHFTAGGNQVDKQAVTPTFHYQEKSNTRTFASSREIGATNFTTDHFRNGDGTAYVPKNARFADTASVASKSFSGTRGAMGNDRAIATGNFTNSRAFLDKGKSQKALSQQSKPLTIEQVRELLNKNK